jgi:DNA invertase Pin-like site-specific DNA recombinase
MRAVALCRLSTEEQAAEGKAGLLRQREDVRVTAARFGLTVVRTFEVVDVSGAVFTTTPECREMLDAVNGADGLIVSALDRIVRPDDFSSFGVYDFFLRNGKRIWTPSGEIDVALDSGYTLTLVQSMVAGLERRSILRRTQSAKEEQRKRGRHANAKITLPRGIDFDFARGSWSWVEPWATRIRRAYDLLLSGWTLRRIAREVGGYTDRGLAIALRNPVWCGVREYRYRRGEKYPSATGRQVDRKKVLRKEPLIVKIEIEPLVTDSEWQRAQEILGRLHEEWNSARCEDSRFLLHGIVRCGCGERMYTRGDKRPGKHDIYYCRSRHPKGPGCGAPVLWRDALDSTVKRLVPETLLSAESLQELIAAASQSAEPQNTAEADRAAAELAKLEKQRERLVELSVQGLFTAEEIIKQRQRIEDEVRLWRGKLGTRAVAAPISPAKLAQQIASLFAEWQYLDEKVQADLLRNVLGSVIVSDRKIKELTVRLPAAGANSRTRICMDSSPRPA